MKEFLSIPAQLIAIIISVLLFGHYVPENIIRLFFTFSGIFKELLGLVLPFMVFFFVLSGITSFKKNAPAVLGVMLGIIFLSNGLVAFLSYGVMLLARSTISCDTSLVSLTNVAAPIMPYITVSLPMPFTAIHALVVALCLGILSNFVAMPLLDRSVKVGKQWIEWIVSNIFIPFLPLYILGFLLKIKSEGIFSCLMQQYGAAFLIIISLQYGYLLWLYFVAAGFSLSKTYRAISNAIPSYITAFSTMSSTAAIPVSIASAEQNTGNKELSEVAMPIMANVHLLGDSIGTPILAMVTMFVFQGVLPGFLQYSGFVFYFCVTMFAASGVPGGGLLVMIPILKSQLGFTSEMISLIMTIYFLLDCFGTGANVMGDGALVMIVNRILKKMRLIEA